MALQMGPSSLLNRHNYTKWKKEVERIFEIEGLKPWLDKATQPKTEGKSSIDDFRINQSKSRAIGLLKSFCTEELELEISDKNDPAEIWEHLANILQEPSRSLKSLYLAEFNNLKREIDEEIPSFIARFEDAYRNITNTGESVSEQHRCYKLLQCLDEGYDHIAREFENCDATKFLFSNLKDEVLKEYNRKKLRELNRPESFAVAREKSIERRNKNQMNICSDCKRNPSLKHKTNKLSKDKNCTFISEFNSESWISKDLTHRSRVWTLDSASNAHICQNLEFFVDMRDPPPESTVRMGTTPHRIKGIGTVKFTIRDGFKIQTIVLKDTLYVPSVHRNLISMARMDNAGYHAKLDRGFKIFSEKWRYLWCAKLKDNFYVIQGTPFPNNITNGRNKFTDNLTFKNKCEDNFQAFLSENDLMLWHQRLGHCNLRTLKTMFDKNLVEPKLTLKGNEEKCEACIFGKNTRATYPKLSQVRSKDILELIHTDIWGPAPQTAKNGYRYILTFLDDYSRRLFCYPLRYKDEVLFKLKNFINFVERQTNKKVKAIRSDNGMEYCSKQMQKLLSDRGIRHEKTNTYSPPQNGAAERVNRILLEGTRTLLKSANLSFEFWLEALETVCYLRNRTLHSSINDIPFRRWYGRKPSLRHLRKFGCVAYIHIPIQKRNKFESKAKKGIFVGYSSNTRGYKIFIPEENKIYESKHVTFNENLLGREENVSPIVTFKFDEDDYKSSNRDYEQISTVKLEEEPKLKEEIENLGEKLKQLTVKDENEDVEFIRYTVTRKTGRTKGQKDIYVLTPEGTRLRSNQELSDYCKTNNLEFDESLNIFSKYSTIGDTFTLKKLSFKQNFESNCTEIVIPRNCKEALKTKEASQWKKAMDAEINNMIKRNVWTPVPKSEKVNKVIGLKWVYTLKNKETENKFKARLVALGNNQREGQDYYETYSPVVNFVLIRLFIVLFICILNWKHTLLDVKCAYLYGKIDTDIYISQPTHYEIPGKEDYVLKLNRALYGLHQAGKCWHEELHNKLLHNGFIQIPGTQCVYRYNNEAIIMVYVDDLPIFAKDEYTLNKVIKLLESLYEVENLGPIKRLLGIEFNITEKGVFISCSKYIETCMTNFNFFLHTKVSLPLQPGSMPSLREQPTNPEQKDAMKEVPYRNLLGCLLYISGRCRPDVSFAVSSLAQMVENPSPSHWKKLVLVLKYLYSTKDYGLWMPADKNALTIAAYCDSSWASDPDTRRSWTGYSIFLNKAPVIWRVVKQTCITLSPMESEFIAASEAAKDVKYLSIIISNIMESMQISSQLFFHKPILFCDNTAAIQFCKYEAENVRNRHIDIKYKFVRELYNENILDIKYVRTTENVADLLTKALPKEMFLKLRAAYLTDLQSIETSKICEVNSTVFSCDLLKNHFSYFSEYQDCEKKFVCALSDYVGTTKFE